MIFTTTSVTSGLGPTAKLEYGRSTEVTATVTPASPGGTIGGAVAFYDNDVLIATVPVKHDPVSGNGHCSTHFNALVMGSHRITAVYSGDSSYSGSSTAAHVPITVFLVGVDLALSSSPNPSALCQSVLLTLEVEVFDGGVPTGTAAFYNDTTPLGSAVTLVNAVATMSTSALPQGADTINASYSGDSHYGANDTFANPQWAITQSVDAEVSVTLTASAAAPDPAQSASASIGPSLVDLLMGSMQLPGAQVDASQSGACSCSCACNDNNSQAGTCPMPIVYNSGTVNVQPIVLATLTTDFCMAVPSSIVGTLTWNGTALPSVSFDTTGHSPGDVYALPFQVATPVLTTGFYPWSVEVLATVGTAAYDNLASGNTLCVVNSGGPVGAGWSIGGLSVLVLGSAGMVDTTSGKSRVFSGTPATLPYDYTSPPNDQGKLTQNADSTFTYTSKFGVQTNFDSTGKQTSQVDPHGLTQTVTYDGSGKLSAITQPDGGVATFNYSGSLINSVAMPGGRFLTLTYDGSNNLTKITDASGAVSTFSYDGSNRLINQQVGPLNTTFAYSGTDNTLISVDRGLGTLTTIAALAAQGLSGSPSLTVQQQVAKVTDSLGNITSHTLDALGRLTQLQTADGALQTWVLDAGGMPLNYIDQLRRVTTNTYDGMENLSFVQNPDNTIRTYYYDPIFQQVTQFTDENSNTSLMSYTFEGDLLSETDAAGNITTFSWSNGLKQTTTDPLGRVTSLTWDATTRRELAEQDALGFLTSFGYDAAGNQITVQDSLNRVTTSTFDGNRRQLTRTNALGGVASNSYDGFGNLVASIDELGRPTTFAYDQRGLQISVTEPISLQAPRLPGIALPVRLATPLGSTGTPPVRTTTMTYDKATNLLFSTNPLGVITSLGYDVLNRPITRIAAFGTSVQRTTTTLYDAVSNVLANIDARGVTASFAYDLRNRRIAQIDAFGTALQRTTTMAYDNVGNTLSIKDPLGTTTSFGYDPDNRQILRIDAYQNFLLQRTTSTSYDVVGNTALITNAIGAVTSMGYDALNRQIQVDEAYGDPAQRTSTMAYDPVGNTLSATDARGITASFGYDALNRRVTQIDALGTVLERTVTMAFDPVGNTLSVTNARIVTTSFGYDALNRRVTQIDAFGTPLQRAVTMAYDAANNVSASIDAAGFQTNFGYDPLNRRVSVQNPDGGIATTAYDLVDNVVNTIDQLGHKGTFIYDVLNRQTNSIDALNGTVTLTFDPNNNLLTLTDPVSNTTTWAYDGLNRQVQETDPLSNISTAAFDPVDRLAAATDKNGQLISYSYDLLNRRTGEAWFDSFGAPTDVLTFGYDPNNNLLSAANSAGTVSLAYDALNRLSNSLDVFGIAMTMGYDAADNRISAIDSFGGMTTRTFDALNRVGTMAFSGTGAAQLREDFAYSVRDQVTRQTRYSDSTGTTTVGYSTMGYDSVGRMTAQQHVGPTGSNIANYANSFDLASRITKEVLNGGAPTSYAYDVTNQLTDDSVVSYSYDPNGNRTMAGYATGPANQLLTDGNASYQYDKNANTTQKIDIASGAIVTFGYDNRNRMTSAIDVVNGMQATYGYDALGRRIESDVTLGAVTTVTRFANDDTRQVWADMDGSNALQMRYLRGDSLLWLPARISGGGTAAWMLDDRMGSVRNVVDASGAVIDTISFDGFGNKTSEANPANGGVYLWDGYRFDSETGLFRPDTSWIRLYGPAVGRWWSVDPILFDSGDANPWRYALNSPTNYSDPSGLRVYVVGYGGEFTFFVGGGLSILRAWDDCGNYGFFLGVSPQAGFSIGAGPEGGIFSGTLPEWAAGRTFSLNVGYLAGSGTFGLGDAGSGSGVIVGRRRNYLPTKPPKRFGRFSLTLSADFSGLIVGLPHRMDRCPKQRPAPTPPPKPPACPPRYILPDGPPRSATQSQGIFNSEMQQLKAMLEECKRSRIINPNLAADWGIDTITNRIQHALEDVAQLGYVPNVYDNLKKEAERALRRCECFEKKK